MTAASAFPPEPNEGRPSEPSMEDILASIRRIIADDQNGAGKAAAPTNGSRRPAAAEAGDGERIPARSRSPYDDVLDLARLVPTSDRGPAEHARSVQAAAPVHQDLGRVAHHDGPAVAEAASGASGLRARMTEPAGRGRTQDEEHDMLDHPVPAVSDDTEGDLLSPPLGDSVMSAFETLAATVVLQNTPMLERVMRDLLRPMLKTWLDDNLPGLVERLVRTEIERVARGSRG